MEFAALGLIVLLAFISDIRRSIIPNMLSTSAAVFGLLYHGFMEGWGGLVHSFLGLAAGFLLLLILYAFGALGAGDVKLFAAIGAIAGLPFVIYSMIYSLLFAGGIGVLILLYRRDLQKRLLNMLHWIVSLLVLHDKTTFNSIKQNRNIRFPFMYAVLPGVMVAYYYTNLP